MDDHLRRLRRVPPAGLLEGLDDRVLGALAVRRREASMAQRFMVLSAFISLGGGALVGVSMGHTEAVASPLTPLAPAMTLAPSVILDAR